MARTLKIFLEKPVVWRLIVPRHEGDSFVAVCDQMGLSVESTKPDDLRQIAEKVTYELFEDLQEHGEVVQFLQDRRIAYKVEFELESSDCFEVTAPTIRTTGAVEAGALSAS